MSWADDAPPTAEAITTMARQFTLAGHSIVEWE
jgi:hypothetical protein